MSYQVLARKWRPQVFSAVVGQQHVLTALANGLLLGRLHHAYLLSGTRGVGKTSIARLLAKGLNCDKEITATPCGKCISCQEIEQGRFIDLIEIDAASRTKVEDTRELLDNVQYAPVRGRFKVYLIDEVHMLSRHSFNALLKTLEEPPAHVKFILATTDPQRLPITVLSRCLQFHLQALNIEQIRTQLEKVLHAEQVVYDARALHLLAKAADGSLRDALSLTDQAIAMGQGQVTTETVSQMLGTLNDEQPLAIIEALLNADAVQLMTQVAQAASRGVDWETLLVESLRLLHQIAMMQLLPASHHQFDDQDQAIELRLRTLAKVLPPADIQLYYQTLLIGRKELVYAPDLRMGVEMTLLRALAFHPQRLIDEKQSMVSQLPKNISTFSSVNNTNDAKSMTESVSTNPLPSVTEQLLQARTQLSLPQDNRLKNQAESKDIKIKKNLQLAADSVLTKNVALKAVLDDNQQPRIISTPNQLDKNNTAVKKEAYRWKAQNQPSTVEAVVTLKTLRNALQYEKNPELLQKLAQEAINRDLWAAEINKLSLPKLVQQLALNTFKQTIESNNICLHLRSSQHHLNSLSARKTLAEALSHLYGEKIELNLIEDDDPAQRTPLEWRQTIYEEKLVLARQSIKGDNNIQMLCHFFDAILDEESIQPI